MMPRLFNYFLIGALLFSMPVCSMSNLPANSATQTMEWVSFLFTILKIHFSRSYSHFEESDMLLDKDDEWLHYLLYSASFMIG